MPGNPGKGQGADPHRSRLCFTSPISSGLPSLPSPPPHSHNQNHCLLNIGSPVINLAQERMSSPMAARSGGGARNNSLLGAEAPGAL